MLTREERRRAIDRVFGVVEFYNGQEDRLGAVLDYVQLAINYFGKLDKDPDGIVTEGEIDRLLAERRPYLSSSQLDAIVWLKRHFHKLVRAFDDGDSNTGISRRDLFEVGKFASWLTYFHKSFDRVDANKDGTLTLDEVYRYVSESLELGESDKAALDKVFTKLAEQKGHILSRADMAAYFDELDW